MNKLEAILTAKFKEVIQSLIVTFLIILLFLCLICMYDIIVLHLYPMFVNDQTTTWLDHFHNIGK